MGYTTDFSGEFKVTPTLKPEHREYLEAFAQTRRMKRDAQKAAQLPDPKREAANLPIGAYGEYFVGNEDNFGQNDDGSILDHNRQPDTQPGLWCQWTPNAEGTAIEWDLGEKFYDYEAWLEYLIRNFLRPWGYTLEGEVEWLGEDPDDRGLIRVSGNEIRIGTGRFSYEFDGKN